MPDWSYRTVFRPLLFRLPAAPARDLCLGLMSALARVPLGPAFIDFLGHMRPDGRLRKTLMGIPFPTAVGLGSGIDINAAALPALARFGIGFMELGPVTVEPVPAVPPIERRTEQQAIWYPDPTPNPGLAALAARLARVAPVQLPLLIRLGARPGSSPAQMVEDCRQMVERLAPFAQVFILMTAAGAGGEGWKEHLEEVLLAARGAAPPRPLFLGVPPDLDPAKTDDLVRPALEQGIGGVVVDGSVRAAPEGRLMGPPAREPALRQVRHLRRRGGSGLVIIGAGGVHEPEQALQLLEAGADLVAIDSGLVYSGPGLPKRINEALLFAGPGAEAASAQPASAAPPAELTWFWTLLLGLSMLLGGMMALGIAATRVVLPYDESFVGMTRGQLAGINDRLLAFMAHDRVSLAGTMITIGVFYTSLSLFGIRAGLHWARVTVLYSALSGFASFFLFLGFGYFDPFHAFVTAILFQFLLLAWHSRLGAAAPPPAPNLHDDGCWRRSLWGQLLFIGHGGVLVAAGLVIAALGSTRVFVPEDLAFMQTTAEALKAANPRLVPLVAHDRASFGGMLIASGLAVLLPALWGYRQGCRWLWWTFLAAGIPAYAAGIGVHFAVGYTDLWHLAPVFAGLGVYAAGLALSYPYLCRKDRAHEEAWKRYVRPDRLAAFRLAGRG